MTHDPALDRLTIEELARHVTVHVNETADLLYSMLTQFIEWGKISPENAAVALVFGPPLMGYLRASIPDCLILIQMRVETWQGYSPRKKRSDTEVRTSLLGYLQDSEMIRNDTARVKGLMD